MFKKPSRKEQRQTLRDAAARRLDGLSLIAERIPSAGVTDDVGMLLDVLRDVADGVLTRRNIADAL